jgi:hypothetical protein
MRSIRRNHSAAVVAAATLISVGACSADLPQSPEPSAVARVVIRPMNDTILVGHTLEYFAVALDAQGRTLTGKTFTWTSLRPGVASITPGTTTDSAHAIGNAIGLTKIVAAADGILSDSATLVVKGLPILGDSDSTKAFNDCSWVPMPAHGWLATLTLSYNFHATGIDSATNYYPYTDFSLAYQESVTVHVNQLEPSNPVDDPITIATWRGSDATGDAGGHITLSQKWTQQTATDTELFNWQGDGPAILSAKDDDFLEISIVKGQGVCAYHFWLSRAEVDGTMTSIFDGQLSSTSAQRLGGGLIESTILPVPAVAASDTGFVLSGRMEFVAQTPSQSPVAPGVFQSFGLADVDNMGLVPSKQFGTAIVSWNFKALP